MEQGRRGFLRTLGGAGLAIVTLPALSTLDFSRTSYKFSLSDVADGNVGAILEQLMRRASRSGGMFVARAFGREEQAVPGNPQPMLSPPTALLAIINRLGLKPEFSNEPDYTDGSQCTDNFKKQESRWRGRFGSYTNIQRASSDRDVAYGVAGNIVRANGSSYLAEAEGAVQYGGAGEFDLVGDAPGALVASQNLLLDGYSLSEKERAQSLAVTEMKSEDAPLIDPLSKTEHKFPSTQYTTPSSLVTYFPTLHLPTGRVRGRSRGTVSVQSKIHDPSRLLFAELYG